MAIELYSTVLTIRLEKWARLQCNSSQEESRRGWGERPRMITANIRQNACFHHRPLFWHMPGHPWRHSRLLSEGKHVKELSALYHVPDIYGELPITCLRDSPLVLWSVELLNSFFSLPVFFFSRSVFHHYTLMQAQSLTNRQPLTMNEMYLLDHFNTWARRKGLVGNLLDNWYEAADKNYIQIFSFIGCYPSLKLRSDLLAHELAYTSTPLRYDVDSLNNKNILSHIHFLF